VIIKLPGGVIVTAGAEEVGTPLSALGIAPITDIDRLVEFGCRDAMTITKATKPTSQKTTEEGHFREYHHQGMDLVTVAREVEIVWASKMLAGFLPRWRILDSGDLFLTAFIQKFGKPFEVKDDVALFGSDSDERAILLAYVRGNALIAINWSCG
jgi:hypothetical protein